MDSPTISSDNLTFRILIGSMAATGLCMLMALGWLYLFFFMVHEQQVQTRLLHEIAHNAQIAVDRQATFLDKYPLNCGCDDANYRK